MLYVMIAISVLVIVVGFCMGFAKGFVKSKWWGLGFSLISAFVLFVLSFLPSLNDNLLDFLLKMVISVATSLIITFVLKAIKSKVSVLSDGVHGLISNETENNEEDELFINQIKGDFEPIQPKKVTSLYVFGNKMLGGINGVINGLVIFFITVLILFSAFDCLNLVAITSSFATFYNSVFWLELKPHIFDILLIGVFYTSITVIGYKTGLCCKLWKVLHIVMIIFSVIGAYLLVVENSLFSSLTEKFAEILRTNVDFLSETTAVMEGVKNIFGFIVANDIAMLISNILFIIVIGVLLILISHFIYKGTNVAFANVREKKFFFTLDSILGGVAVFLLITCGLLLLGGILFAVNGTPALEMFNQYAENSTICNLFYTENPINWLFI